MQIFSARQVSFRGSAVDIKGFRGEELHGVDGCQCCLNPGRGCLSKSICRPNQFNLD